MEILKNILLPIITFVIAIISLFTNTKQIKGLKGLLNNKSVVILIILIFTSSASLILNSIKETKEANDAKDKLKQISTTTSDGYLLTKKIYNILEVKLSSYGVKEPEKMTLSQIEEISNANDKRQDIIKNSINTSRKEIVVKYFQKDVDGNKVINAFKELDFQLLKGKAKIPNGETNAIYYGNNVDIESIKLVALTLFRAGVQLKEIIPFISNEGREYEIQIVHTDELKSNENFDVKKIENFIKK